MSEPVERFPRGVLIAATALIALTIVAAATARWTGIGRVQTAEGDRGRVVELRFEDRADGGVDIRDAANGRLVDTLAPGSSGFVRTVMRSLVRERRQHADDRQTPFRLIEWTDGRLSMEDPATGRHIDLGAFGAPNTAAFARLMTAGGVTR